ncbi:MAG: helix-turn-helix domain-containing protein [Propionibacteriaceae bacterium]|jgi:DNA-binding PucR family transcriptional regulator|nr:helix-turn-helix domain-containing protein [Propionibacteriaceae bacterium]
MEGWWPPDEVRAQVASRMQAMLGTLTTSALTKIAADNPWINSLNAEHRSWISVVAQAGISGFIEWFAAAGASASAMSVFSAAPRVLARRITLQQTVDLVRSTIDAVETEIDAFPAADQNPLRLAVVHYSREIAFAAAQTYARAAEARGAWDARLEALAVDAVIRGEAELSLMSQAASLGWSKPEAIAVVIGPVPADPAAAVERIRKAAARSPLELLAAPQGDRLVLVIGAAAEVLAAPENTVAAFADEFGPGHVVIGPVVSNLDDAPRSARSALSGMRAARAWSGAPRLVRSADLLPERALAGDGHARRLLADSIYAPLSASPDLEETLTAYFDHGGSIEATARALYVHANTVRYRLKRVQDVTGRSPADPRDSYAIRLALTLGRLFS